jgi:hypothetical protein
MGAHAGRAAFSTAFGSVSCLARHSATPQPAGQVAVQRIMGRGLVGDDVGARAARLHPCDQFGEDIGGIAQKAHGFRLALRGPVGDQGQRLVQRMGLGIDVAGADAEIDPRLVTFHRKAAGPRHHGGQGVARRPCRPRPPVRIQRPLRLPP